MFFADLSWHLVLQSSFVALFSKDGQVEFQERSWYPRAIPHMWCHLALQVHHQFGSIKRHRLVPNEKGYWCTPKPENLAGSLGMLELFSFYQFYLLQYFKCKLNCLKSCLRWNFVAIGSTETGFGLNLPWESSIYFSSRLATWEMTNEMRATMPHPWRVGTSGVTRSRHGDVALKGISSTTSMPWFEW